MSVEHLDLVQHCLNGDDEAWAELVAEYRSLIYSICHLSNISDHDADDLAQEAFIKIWMNLPNYDPKRGALSSWISSLTRNLRVDRFRRQRQERMTDSMDEGWDESGEMTLALPARDGRQSPDSAAVLNEATKIVCEALKQVSPVMLDAVSLRIFQELDNREIAFQLSIPEGTVKSRVNRGLAQLVALLNPQKAALGVA